MAQVIDGNTSSGYAAACWPDGHFQADQALLRSDAHLRLARQLGGIAGAEWSADRPAEPSSTEFRSLYGLEEEREANTYRGWLDLIHADDRGRVASVMADLMEGEAAASVTFRIPLPGGAVRWIAMRAEACRDPDGSLRVISAHHDATDAVSASLAHGGQQDACGAETVLTAVFGAMARFMCVLAPDGTALLASRPALDECGLDHAGVAGSPFWDLPWWPPSQRERLRADIARAAAGTAVRRDVLLPASAGDGRWMDLHLRPMRDPATGTVSRIIAEWHDVTQIHGVAEKLAQAEKAEALGLIAGGMAHAMNNILQSVHGSAALIERCPENHERSRRLAHASMEATERGAAITQRMLSFARHGALHAQAVVAADLLDGTQEMLAHTVGKDIEIRTSVPAELPPMLGDRWHLETALVNLAMNARDAMPGGGRLAISAEAVDVADGAGLSGPAPGSYVRISLADNGSGMDAATLARATEPFFTTKPHGTGMGMAAVTAFAEESGGAVTVDSAPGEGTTVSLWLRQARDERIMPQPQARKLRGMARKAPARVLLVDDDELVLATLATQIRDLGLKAITAGGAEALALLDGDEAVDALVSDLAVGDVNGASLIRKAQALRPGLPCFVLTGHIGERALPQGWRDFAVLRKPISGVELAARIEAVLGAERQ